MVKRRFSIAMCAQTGFADAGAGNDQTMIGVGLGLLLIGIVFLFVIPWIGVPVAIVGLVLAVLAVAGFGKSVGHRPTAR